MQIGSDSAQQQSEEAAETREMGAASKYLPNKGEFDKWEQRVAGQNASLGTQFLRNTQATGPVWEVQGHQPQEAAALPEVGSGAQ